MLDDLTKYFNLTLKFRSPTSNFITRSVILKDMLPSLASSTTSARLKLAISKFIGDNNVEKRYNSGN